MSVNWKSLKWPWKRVKPLSKTVELKPGEVAIICSNQSSFNLISQAIADAESYTAVPYTRYFSAKIIIIKN